MHSISTISTRNAKVGHEKLKKILKNLILNDLSSFYKYIVKTNVQHNKFDFKHYDRSFELSLLFLPFLVFWLNWGELMEVSPVERIKKL